MKLHQTLTIHKGSDDIINIMYHLNFGAQVESIFNILK